MPKAPRARVACGEGVRFGRANFELFDIEMAFFDVCCGTKFNISVENKKKRKNHTLNVAYESGCDRETHIFLFFVQTSPMKTITN